MQQSQRYHSLPEPRAESPPRDVNPESMPLQSTEHLNLDDYGYERSNKSRPSRSSHKVGEYDGSLYQYGGDDIETQGLVSEPVYRVYKRRWIGLLELTLLNLAIGWGYTAPGVVSTTAIEWYNITYPELNNLNIASLVVFALPAPFVIWVLNKSGPKLAIIIACVFTVVGNWIVYAGAKTHNFPVNIAGSVIGALASPFVLSAPTRYSRIWFNDKGRTLATALPSLAYPLGVGIGAMTGPFMVKPVGPFEYDAQQLIVAIIFTAVALPAPFIPARPPVPPSKVASAKTLNVRDSLVSLAKNPVFYLQFSSFSFFAGAFDASASLLNQLIEPYGFSQLNAGFSIVFMIFTGILLAFIIAPILDRTKAHLLAQKIIIPIVAIAYTILPFIPETKSVPALYAVYALIGGASISMEPCALEFQANWTHPVSPEFSSVLCWTGAKVMGAVFVLIVGNDLWLKKEFDDQPQGSIMAGLIFQSIMVWLCVPFALMTGFWIFKRPTASIVAGTL